MENRKRQIAGVLKVPMIFCWIFFAMHFTYIGLYHGIWKRYIDIYDIIIDVFLLFSIEVIAVLLTLSNNRNNFTLFKIAFILSIVNALFILFYIFIVVFSFFVRGKMKKFIKAETWITKDDWWKGLILIVIKIFELLPLIIIIVYQRKIESPVGTINPQNIDSGSLMNNNNNNKDDEDELE